MMKTGAAAIMAIATLSASAAAQDASAPAPSCATLWAHCVGPEPGDDATCCPGTQCVQKNQQYAQCRPVGETSPVEWMGNVITSKTMTDDPTEVADADTDEEPEPGLIMDAEDIVEMGMAPPGMDAEDLEEMGFEPGMDEEDMIELGIIPGEEDADAPADDDGTGEEKVVGVMIGSLGDEASAPKASAPMPSEIENEVVYKAVVGKDYSPSTDGTAQLVDVMNTGNKYEVASTAECEDLCTITSGCNAASYYLDGTPYGGPNCWLKTLANSCEMPADAEDDANAVFLLQLNPSCESFEEHFEAAFGPIGAPMDAPAGAPEEVPLLETVTNTTLPEDNTTVPDVNTTAVASAGTGSRSLNDPSTVVADIPENGAVSVQGALIAMAVAGAAALL